MWHRSWNLKKPDHISSLSTPANILNITFRFVWAAAYRQHPLPMHQSARHADAPQPWTAFLGKWVQLPAALHVGCDCRLRCAHKSVMQTNSIPQFARGRDAGAVILTWQQTQTLMANQNEVTLQPHSPPKSGMYVAIAEAEGPNNTFTWFKVYWSIELFLSVCFFPSSVQFITIRNHTVYLQPFAARYGWRQALIWVGPCGPQHPSVGWWV